MVSAPDTHVSHTSVDSAMQSFANAGVPHSRTYSPLLRFRSELDVVVKDRLAVAVVTYFRFRLVAVQTVLGLVRPFAEPGRLVG